ncbi:hypothetical protein IW138_005107 [Coemansia sp. RSA 986]|nr:hypothetical protein LPJ74_003644 [Coemansia sp. RSA 1843]KAJ2087261.1 hypothetical protein IW138_005107 [Coemansia sp. RSA 986]
MYNSNSHGTQSYSTPASPNSYSTATPNNAEGKVAYDKELASLFRATAANVTQLYKEASEIGSNAFKAGYEQCYSDMCEYIASENQNGGSELNAEGQQLVIQRLREFARRKHIAQHHSASEVNTPSPGFSRMGHPESRASGDGEPDNSAELECEDGGNNTGNGQMDSIASNDSGDQCRDLPRGSTSRNEHGTPRGKRMLESFDLMDIEPPRRRLRRDDIEMA